MSEPSPRRAYYRRQHLTPLVIDIETLGTDPRKGSLLCVGWASEAGAGVDPALVKQVATALADPSVPIISHTKYDPVWFKKAGFVVHGPYYDTQTMAHLLNENTQLDLESLVKLYCGYDMDKRLVKAEKKIWFTTDQGQKLELAEAWAQYADQVMHYCKRDAEATLDLYTALRKRMVDQGWEKEWLEEHAPFTEILVDMECAGIPVDLDNAAHLKGTLEERAESAKSKLIDDIGYSINFNSAKQLVNVLFTKVWEEEVQIEITKEQRDCLRQRCEHTTDDNTHEESNHILHYKPPSWLNLTQVGTKYMRGTVMRKGLGLVPKVKSEKTKQPSTSKGVLAVYHGDHPIVKDLVNYRELEKVIGTYLATYPEHSWEGRLYGRFNQTGTVTGRLSHSNPNLGNQPAHGELGTAIRSLFTGRFIVGDHSQLEPRLMADRSQDPVLLDIYRTGKDIYLVTASYIFGRKVEKHEPERQLCKTLMLALGYGAGAAKLAQTMCVNGFWTSKDTAQGYLDHLEELFGVFFQWKKHVIREAKYNGYVKTIGGRYRRLRWAFGDAAWKVRSKGERQAVNSIIQGSAADILRRNMLHCVSFKDILLLNQVHDELIWEYPEQYTFEPNTLLTAISKTCENPGYDLSVPLAFEPSFCKTWADKGNGITIPEEDPEIEE